MTYRSRELDVERITRELLPGDRVAALRDRKRGDRRARRLALRRQRDDAIEGVARDLVLTERLRAGDADRPDALPGARRSACPRRAFDAIARRFLHRAPHDRDSRRAGGVEPRLGDAQVIDRRLRILYGARLLIIAREQRLTFGLRRIVRPRGSAARSIEALARIRPAADEKRHAGGDDQRTHQRTNDHRVTPSRERSRVHRRPGRT